VSNRLKQLRLFQNANPLLQIFGKSFFKELPVSSGVYLMRDSTQKIIYVGKAKNLKLRLKSYSYAHEENVSRKVLRLIHAVKSIEWELAIDEKHALIRENYLLRTHQPFFNVLNTSPHTYLFSHLKLEETGIRFHLSMKQDEHYPQIYGAFKSISLTLNAHKAIFRLLWASIYGCKNGFEFPAYLTNRKKLDHFLFPLAIDSSLKMKLYRQLKRFYNGSSKYLLIELTERLLKRDDLALFMKSLLQHDIELAGRFYSQCAHRNRQIKLKFKTQSKLILQDQIDDFLVEFKYLPKY
jgi:hypothetical protein